MLRGTTREAQTVKKRSINLKEDLDYNPIQSNVLCVTMKIIMIKKDVLYNYSRPIKGH